MNANPNEKSNRRSLEPQVDLRTFPSGWDLSSLYAPSANWVNDPQHSSEAPYHPNREDQPSNGETSDAV
jgi:hypothetical protein